MSRKQEENANISITIEFTLLIPDEAPSVHVSHAAVSVSGGTGLGSESKQNSSLLLSIIGIYFSIQTRLKANKAGMTEIL